MEDIAVGKVFPGKNELFSFFEDYFQQNYQPFVRHVVSETSVVFRCAHGRKTKSKSMGKRPNQHYLFTGCNARINLYKGKENYWKVTLVELSHNHSIGKEEFSIYRRRSKLTDQDYALISNLVQAKVKDSVVAHVLKTKRDKFLTRKDVTNIRAKLFHKRYIEEENNDTDVGVELNNEFVKDTVTSGNVSVELINSSDNNKVKILTKNEKCKIAMELFSRQAEILSNLGTKEFYEVLEKANLFFESLYEEVFAFVPVPGTSLEDSSSAVT